MVNFRHFFTVFSPLIASTVISLPVAEEKRIPRSAIDDVEDASSSAYPSLHSPSESSIRWADDQSSSSRKGQQSSGAPTALAEGLSSTATYGNAELKRDDMRKYDRPRTWVHEDFRAIYLEGLARSAREGGDKRKEKRFPSDELSDSRASPAEKRDSTGESQFPPSRDTNESDMRADQWGLTYEDYEQFYNSHLSENYPHWNIQQWQNFVNRYLEFQASGGQVGKGNRRRSDLWKDTEPSPKLDDKQLEAPPIKAISEKRDDMYKYDGGLDDYDDYLLSSLYCDTEACLNEKRASMPTDSVPAPNPNGEMSTRQEGGPRSLQETTYDQHEEQEQQAEGVEQARTEQSGGGKVKKQRWQWVPEEEELTEGLPENAAHDRAKRERLPTTTEGEPVGGTPERKRHCGRSDLPEGYGSNVTALCG